MNEEDIESEADLPKEEEQITINEEEPPKLVTIPETELELIQRDAEVYKDKYLRLLAENDNMRKRLHRDSQEMTQRAVESIILAMLHPIDHLENALKFTEQASGDVKQWATGFQMILNQFKDILADQGVIPFQSEGKPFNPHHHEAIEMIPTNDFPPGTVLSESVKGYKMGDRTIRPARVTVAKAIESQEDTK